MQKVLDVDQSVIDEVERTKWKRVLNNLIKDWRLYVLLIPMLAFLICFKYMPIGGILTGFKWGNYDVGQEFYNSQWCGLGWFAKIFVGVIDTDTTPILFWTAFRNTFVNSMYGLIFGFPIPIILALLFSEVKSAGYRSFLQVCCYLPHFVSLVVVTSIIALWTQINPTTGATGIIYKICEALGGTNVKVDILNQPKFFRPIYQVSGIWEGAGYGSIVYFAAIIAISPTSYEAARIDGASKLQQIRYVTFPGMAPTLTIMLIMRIGQILNIGYEKVILLVGDKESAWETADVISSFVYRLSGAGGENVPANTIKQVQVGIAADLFNSIIAMFLVLGANAISRRVSSTSLF